MRDTSFYIPKRNRSCFLKGESLAAGQGYYSLLIEEKGEMIRQDYCLSCWQEIYKRESLSQTLIFWKSSSPSQKISLPSSRVSQALSLLRLLLQEPEHYEAEIFVLALFLARCRELILKQEIEKEGESYFLYQMPLEEEWVAIKKVGLSSLKIQDIQNYLAQRLSYSHAPASS